MLFGHLSSLFTWGQRVLSEREHRRGVGDELGLGGQGVGGAEGVRVGGVVGLILHAVDGEGALFTFKYFRQGWRSFFHYSPNLDLK